MVAPTGAPMNPKNKTDSKPGKTLGNMVETFESITTVNHIRGGKTLHWTPSEGKLWQRNYWDRIIERT